MRSRASNAVGGALALAALALAACETTPRNAVTRCDQTTIVPSRTDILFVVDDSNSMSEEQANLAANLDRFIDRLASAPVRPDYQIGVTTTSVQGFGGEIAYATGPSAGVPYPDGALVALDPTTHAISYDATAKRFTGARVLPATSPSLAADFKANVQVGVNGSGKEEALQAIRHALSDRIADGTNAGFLRSGARLAIVILSDEDDCTEPAGQRLATSNTQCRDEAFKAASLEPVQDFVSFLQAPIAGEVRDVAVAGVIATAVDPATRTRTSSCSTAPDAAVRYWDFTHAFGEAGLVDSICNPSFAASLDAIAGLIAQRVALSQAPSDPALLQATVVRADGSRVACRVGQGASGSVDAVYAPPSGAAPATLTFQRGCLLAPGDRIELKILCAG